MRSLFVKRLGTVLIVSGLSLVSQAQNSNHAPNAVPSTPASGTLSNVPQKQPTPLVDSEYFWQAYEDEFLFVPAYQYHYSVQNQTDYALTNYNLGGGASDFSLQAEYGIADLIAIGVKTGYSTGTTQVTEWNPATYYYGYGANSALLTNQGQTTSQGMDNITFYTKARYRFNKRLTTYAGIGFDWSPDSRRISDYQGDSNRFTGANTLRGHVGAEYSIKKFIIGADFRADIYKSSATTVNYLGQQVLTSGALTRSISGFGELVGRGFQAGAAFSYNMVDPSVLSQSGYQNVNIDGVNMMELKAYGAILVTEWLNLLPSFAYQTMLNKTLNGRNVNQQYDLIGTVGARFSM